MLVLARKVGESIMIGDNIKIVVAAVLGWKVQIGITAPLEVKVLRGEIWDQNRAALEQKKK